MCIAQYKFFTNNSDLLSKKAERKEKIKFHPSLNHNFSSVNFLLFMHSGMIWFSIYNLSFLIQTKKNSFFGFDSHNYHWIEAILLNRFVTWIVFFFKYLVIYHMQVEVLSILDIK